MPEASSKEELPTDAIIHYATEEKITKEEIDSIRELKERVEKLLETGGLPEATSARLDAVVASLQEIEKGMSSVAGMIESRSEEFAHGISSVSGMKGEMQEKIDSVESYGRNMESLLEAFTTNLGNFLLGLDKKLEGFKTALIDLESMKEETVSALGTAVDSIKPQAEDLSLAVSYFGSAKNEIASMQAAAKETNIKLSVLADSMEEKVSELSSIPDGIARLENIAELQTASIRSIADIMTEFSSKTEERYAKLDAVASGLDAFQTYVNGQLGKLDGISENTKNLADTSKDVSELISNAVDRFNIAAESMDTLSRTRPLMEKLSSDVENVYSSISASSVSIEKFSDRAEQTTARFEESYRTINESNQEVLASLEQRANTLNSAEAQLQSVISQLNAAFESLSGMKSDISAASSVLSEKASMIEKASSSMENIHSDISASSETLRQVARQAEESVSMQRTAYSDMKEFIEAAENTVQSIQSAQQEMEENRKVAATYLEERIRGLNAAETELQNLIPQINQGLGSIKSDVAAATGALNQATENAENSNNRIVSLEQGLENMLKLSEDNSSSTQIAISELKSTTEKSEKAVNSAEQLMQSVRQLNDSIEEHERAALSLMEEKSQNIGAASRELQDVKSQLMPRLAELDNIKSAVSGSVEALNKNTSLMEKASAAAMDANYSIARNWEKLESFGEQLDEIVSSQKAVSAELKTSAEKVEETTKSADRKTDDILNIIFRKVADIEKIGAAIEKSSSELTAGTNKLLEAAAKMPVKKAARASRPKARARKATVIKVVPRTVRVTAARKEIEDEALDMLIINSLKNVSMNIASLEKATNVSESRLRKRLNVLITRGVVAKERKGRSVFYALKGA